MYQNQIEVQVLVKGKPVKEITHQGNTYIEGRIGTEYTLKVKNNTYSRVMAVVSVDGINVITGDPASSNSDPGYIINGHSAVDIKGYRKDLETVGAFKFCQRSQSYCNDAGAPGNNGVIGVIVFEEEIKIQFEPVKWIPIEPVKPWPAPPPYPLWKPRWYGNNSTLNTDGITYTSHNTDEIRATNCCYSQSISESSEDNGAFGVGTTWGEAVHDSVTTVPFEVDRQIASFTIYYASVKGLGKLGVPVKKEKKVAFPKAFDGFAKPPRGWRG